MDLKNILDDEHYRRNFFEAIEQGVYRAFNDAIRNATDAPTDDIMNAIQSGVENAFHDAAGDVSKERVQ